MQSKQIWRVFSDKIDYLIWPDNPTFPENNDVKGIKFFQSLKENLTNIIFLGRKETLVTAARIIAKSCELKHARAFMEENFNKLGEHKYASIIQGKQKNGKEKYILLRKTYDIISSGGNLTKYNHTFCIDTIKFVSLMQLIQKYLQL